jgi:putative FmdB family regulatory protein
MPTYEYACRECGQHLEVVQSFTEDPLTTCASCGGQLRKVFSAAGIIFKGSGYYVTDSRTSPAAGKGKADAKGGKDTAAAADSGSADGASGSGGGSGATSGSDADSRKSGSDSSGSSSGGEAKSA